MKSRNTSRTGQSGKAKTGNNKTSIKKKKRRPKKTKLSWTRRNKGSFLSPVVLLGTEICGLSLFGIALVLLLLGSAGHHFSGTDLMGSLLPFLLSVFVVCLLLALGLIFWWRIRKRLEAHSILFVPMFAVFLAIVAGIFVSHERSHTAYGNLRTMIGGKTEVNRRILSHQVYAAYRRLNGAELLKLVKRAEPFSQDIIAAASAFELDPDLLFGLAAAESSFYPRKSQDGGVGLFQITNVPRDVNKKVAAILEIEAISTDNHRHNAFIASATLRRYLRQMGGDLLLGLLAYNIGPENGGLRFIMEQYKVHDFNSIQPYLQSGPRQYPIRVLSYALAFRIWHRYGQMLSYEKKGNALRIQKIAIPGIGKT